MLQRRVPWLLVLAGVLTVLVATVAVLQYRWLGELATMERERLQTTLRSRSAQVATDFDRELTRAFLWLRREPPAPDGPDNDGPERFVRWYRDATHAALIADIFSVDVAADGTAALSRFDRASGIMQAAAWPASLAALRGRLDAENAALAGGAATANVTRHLLPPIAPEIPALVIARPNFRAFFNDRRDPTRDRDANDGGTSRLPGISYTVATIDEQYVRSALLPELIDRVFSEPERKDTRVALVDAATGRVIYRDDDVAATEIVGSPDATATMFSLRSSEFGRFVIETRRSDARRGDTAPDGGDGSRRDRPRDHRTALLSTDRAPGAWTLAVQHRLGSLEAAVARTRRRNLALSSGVLLLLAAATALAVVSAARARRLARQQVEFVAGVSHELRTPLAVIRSAAENLADGVVSQAEQVQRYGAVIAGEGRRLTEMVEQVMEFAGFEAGRSSGGREVVPPAAIVADALGQLRSLVEERGIVVETRIADDLPPISADVPALVRAVNNLLSNAIKYGGHSRWIGVTVSAGAKRRRVKIAVSDRGGGIDAAEADRVFEPFFRGRAAIAAQIPGSGLGLSLVRRIVAEHGGEVAVDSDRARGSTFTIDLPAAPDSAVASRAGALAEQA